MPPLHAHLPQAPLFYVDLNLARQTVTLGLDKLLSTHTLLTRLHAARRIRIGRRSSICGKRIVAGRPIVLTAPFGLRPLSVQISFFPSRPLKAVVHIANNWDVEQGLRARSAYLNFL